MKYIKVYDNVITKTYCDILIEKFHKNKKEWIERETNIYKFNEINLVKSRNIFENDLDYLYNVFDTYVDLYRKDCGVRDYQFPQTYGFEEIRMKHYKAGEGEFKPHIDSNESSIKRFLVFFLYLDSGEGGETIFYDHKTLCERKPGRLLMFPPMWTYPHAGLMPIQNDKHIIGSYLHYPNVN